MEKRNNSVALLESDLAQSNLGQPLFADSGFPKGGPRGNAGTNAVRQVVKLNNAVVNFSYDNQGNLTSGDGLSIQYN